MQFSDSDDAKADEVAASREDLYSTDILCCSSGDSGVSKKSMNKPRCKQIAKLAGTQT